MNLSETAEVLATISKLRREGTPMAIATIVSVHGSTYRRPGARLLVPKEGEPVGNLSGGCLEGQVTEIARDVMASEEPRLEFYDLTADDEVVWGWGLGCNGAIEVFIEPAGRAAESADALRRAIEDERLLAGATVIESSAPGVDVGARMLITPEGVRDGSLGSEPIDEQIVEVCGARFASGDTEIVEVDVAGGRARVFIEVLVPPLRLLVCGAGHDAIPLVRLGASMGWRVEVIDDRASMLDAGRFPGATGFVETPPGDLVEAARVDDRCYVVVMSHNYLRDRDYLRALLNSRAAYVGMLGPRARLQRLLDDLATEGVHPEPDQAERIFGPAGLDLGAEGPEEIAAAIVSEVLAVNRARGAGFLRERAGAIHERV